MAWSTPKTNWTTSDGVSAADLNRIEGNNLELKKAATIDIVDAGNYITATNVEAALQELGNEIVTGKSSLATAITSKGQASTTADTLNTMATKVNAIGTGTDATAAQILAGKKAFVGSATITGTMPNLGSEEYTGYHRALARYGAPGRIHLYIDNGAYLGATVDGMGPAGKPGIFFDDANFTPGNIRSGTSMLGLVGTGPKYDVGSNISPFVLGAVSVAGNFSTAMTGWGDNNRVPLTLCAGANCAFAYGYVSATNTYTLLRINSAGTIDWSGLTGVGIGIPQLIVTKDGLYLYTLRSDTGLTKYNASTMAQIWNVPAATLGAGGSPGSYGGGYEQPVVVDSAGNIYFSWIPSLKKVTAAGSVAWSISVPNSQLASMDLSVDESYVIHASASSYGEYGPTFRRCNASDGGGLVAGTSITYSYGVYNIMCFSDGTFCVSGYDSDFSRASWYYGPISTMVVSTNPVEANGNNGRWVFYSSEKISGGSMQMVAQSGTVSSAYRHVCFATSQGQIAVSYQLPAWASAYPVKLSNDKANGMTWACFFSGPTTYVVGMTLTQPINA